MRTERCERRGYGEYGKCCEYYAPQKYHHRGFTLIEVMVAVAIFAIAGLALLNAQGSQINTDQHLQEKTFAHWVALNQLADMRLNQVFPDTGESQATASMGNQDWQITITVQSTPSPDVRLVIISVAPKSEDFDKKAEPVTSLTGFLSRDQTGGGQSNAGNSSS
jgi:general secretion pathway protein I